MPPACYPSICFIDMFAQSLLGMIQYLSGSCSVETRFRSTVSPSSFLSTPLLLLLREALPSPRSSFPLLPPCPGTISHWSLLHLNGLFPQLLKSNLHGYPIHPTPKMGAWKDNHSAILFCWSLSYCLDLLISQGCCFPETMWCCSAPTSSLSVPFDPKHAQYSAVHPVCPVPLLLWSLMTSWSTSKVVNPSATWR